MKVVLFSLLTSLLLSAAAAAESAPQTTELLILSDQGPNVTAWLTAPLNVAVPGDIRQNLTFLREDLLDEGKQKPVASLETYSLGYQLCNGMITALDERDEALARAGYRNAQANNNTVITSQALEARRSGGVVVRGNYKKPWVVEPWPQYFREKDERNELTREAKNSVALSDERVKLDWADRTAKIRKRVDALYGQFRNALRKNVLPEEVTRRVTPAADTGNSGDAPKPPVANEGASNPSNGAAPAAGPPKGNKNVILRGMDPKGLTTEEAQLVQGLGIAEIEMPEKQGPTYFHVDTAIDNQSTKSAIQNRLSVEGRILCAGGDGRMKVIKYSHPIEIGVKGPQRVSLTENSVRLNMVKQYNNNDKTPKNV